jgi:hypothetical protein
VGLVVVRDEKAVFARENNGKFRPRWNRDPVAWGAAEMVEMAVAEDLRGFVPDGRILARQGRRYRLGNSVKT